MGHLLETINPEAAERVNGEARPMPGVCEMVRYHPRPGEVRQGRTIVPAIVLKVDESNRQLELMVIHGSDDMITQNRVPEHVEGDRGWSRLPGADFNAMAEMARKIDDLQNSLVALGNSMMADFVMPEGESVMSLIDSLDGRMGAIEDAANMPGPTPAPPNQTVSKAAVVPRGGRANRRRGATGS